MSVFTFPLYLIAIPLMHTVFRVILNQQEFFEFDTNKESRIILKLPNKKNVPVKRGFHYRTHLCYISDLKSKMRRLKLILQNMCEFKKQDLSTRDSRLHTKVFKELSNKLSNFVTLQ